MGRDATASERLHERFKLNDLETRDKIGRLAVLAETAQGPGIAQRDQRLWLGAPVLVAESGGQGNSAPDLDRVVVPR